MSHGETLARLGEKLARLAARDPDLDAFGSTGHVYRLAPPLGEAELAAWETRLGVRLPDEYRAYVSQRSASGAGPSYGLYTIAEIERELDDDRPPGAPFPLTGADADRIHALRQQPDTQFAFHDAPYPLPGSLPICHHGCGWNSVLVLTGELAGCLWYAGEGWCLERDDDGQPLGFFAWYERWLDACLASPKIPDPHKIVFGLDKALALVNPNTVGKLWMHCDDHPVVPETLGQLTRLRALSLYASHVERLPESIGALAALEELSVSSNPLAVLPEGVRALTALTQFDAMDCPNLSAAHVIERLDGRALSKLRLGDGAPCRELPARLGEFSALTVLDLSGLGLETPPPLGALPRLGELYLARNQLRTLPGLGELGSLTRLSLADNPLAELPELTASGLEHLWLGGLALAELPPWLSRLGKLVTLHLERTPRLDLAGVCRRLAGTTSLRSLELGGPTLRALPDELADLTSLDTVYLEGCPALDLGAACAVLARLPGLRELRLGRNQLTVFPPALYALAPTLEVLRLDDNPLRELPREIARFTRLRGLDLGGTEVRVLPRELRTVRLGFERFPPGAVHET